jgi:hypothetical protein
VARTDIQTILEASAVLDIAEYKLFVEAYKKWYGRKPENTRIERLYLAYMFNGVVPPFARDYARQVLEEAGRHELDPIRFGITPKLGRRAKFGLGMAALNVALVTALIYLADHATRLIAGLKGCMLPPCY